MSMKGDRKGWTAFKGIGTATVFMALVTASVVVAAVGAAVPAEAPAAAAPAPAMVTPGIPGEGPIHPLPNAAYQPSKDETYKVVFALTKAGDTPQEVSPSLLRVVRTVNLYASAGVPLTHLKFVAIAYGPATGIVLDDEHYKVKFGTGNPNLAIIHKLKAAGVDVAVCGQAVIEHQFDYAWISHDVTVALSALTTITVLEHQGYSLMPL